MTKRLDFLSDSVYNVSNADDCEIRLSEKISNGGVFFMAYKISDECLSCGACEAECPVNAISAGDGKYEINADECIECGACAGVCPVGAPEQE